MSREIYFRSKPPNKFLLDLKKKQLEAKVRIDKEEVSRLYTEFQSFMNWNSAPDFNIKIYKEDDGKLARVARPTDDSPKFVLNINDRAKAICQDSYKALLFHEFTHIHDCIFLDPYFAENGVEKIRGWYAEANAVVVELMCLCGFQNIEEKKRMDLSFKISYHDRLITLDEYFLLKFNGIKAKVDKNDYDGISKPIQYYFGCWRFYSEYCTFSEPDYIRLSKSDYFREHFGTCLSRMSRIIRKFDLSPEQLKIMDECSKKFVAMSARKIVEAQGDQFPPR